MQNFEEIGRELERQGKTDVIKRLAESDDGVKLSQMVDTQALEQAARQGNGDALKAMLSQVLSTAEGQRLAENVRKLMEK